MPWMEHTITITLAACVLDMQTCIFYMFLAMANTFLRTFDHVLIADLSMINHLNAKLIISTYL